MSEDLAQRAQRARLLATQLQDTGGVVGQVDLAARWGVSEATVSDDVGRHDFPEPFAKVGRRSIWLAAEIDLWRSEHPLKRRQR